MCSQWKWKLWSKYRSQGDSNSFESITEIGQSHAIGSCCSSHWLPSMVYHSLALALTNDRVLCVSTNRNTSSFKRWTPGAKPTEYNNGEGTSTSKQHNKSHRQINGCNIFATKENETEQNCMWMRIPFARIYAFTHLRFSHRGPCWHRFDIYIRFAYFHLCLAARKRLENHYCDACDRWDIEGICFVWAGNHEKSRLISDTHRPSAQFREIMKRKVIFMATGNSSSTNITCCLKY